MDTSTALVLAAAGFGAGSMNALAGGGTILTFPALVLAGIGEKGANATSTVALVPAAIASLWGYRREVETHRPWMRTLLVPSLVGGAAGALLLDATPEADFARIAPWLVLFATVLFFAQTVLQRRKTPAGAEAPAGSLTSGADAPAESPTPGAALPGRLAFAWTFQFATALYGGYFGAGIGILMLATLGFLGLRDILAMNGLKNLFGACINGVACGWFIVRGLVDWPAALATMAGAVVGGLAGAHFARYVGREKARWLVVAVGLTVTALLLTRSDRQ